MSDIPEAPAPKFPSRTIETPAPDTRLGVRYVDGVMQLKADDGLWYDLKLARDQGSTVLDVDQVGE